jgi:EthD domain
MHKLLIFLKRKPGLSLEEFRAYYEGQHVPLIMNYMKEPVRYVRRFLEPTPDIPEMDFDVITELWFKERATVDFVIKMMTDDNIPADVIADEHRFLDRSKSRFHAVVEHETELC